MKKDYTHITVVLDRSGSMQSCWSDTIGGLKGVVKEQKELKLGSATFSLVTFDDHIEKPCIMQDIQSVDIDSYKICPRGMTALIDATCMAIDETGEKLAKMDEKDRPEKVMFVVQTDGLENSSREFKADQLKEKIKNQKDKYGWEFLFIGASEESLGQAVNQLGFSASSSMKYSGEKTLGTFNTLNTKMRGMRVNSVGSDAYLASTLFSEEDRKDNE